MPTQEVIASPVSRKDRADQEFRGLFTALFAPLTQAVNRVVPERAVAERITRDAFLELLRHWRRVNRSEPPDAWVRRLALREAHRAAQQSTVGPVDTEPADASAWEQRTEAVYAAVLEAAERGRRRRVTALAGAAATAALVTAAILVPGGEADAPSAAAGLAAPPWAIEPRGHPLGGPLDGRWQTQLVTRADVANALRRAGLADHADHASVFPAGRFRIRLTVDGGRSVLTVGQEREVRIFRVDEQRVTLEALPPNVAVSHFRWSGERPWLTLAYAGPGLVKHDAIASQIHEVALYTTARFERARP